jgi:hypothetical protein
LRRSVFAACSTIADFCASSLYAVHGVLDRSGGSFEYGHTSLSGTLDFEKPGNVCLLKVVLAGYLSCNG